MIKDEIKTILQNEAYHFLKTEPDLENIIYLVASGSYGYGTYNSTSDLDLRGVLVEKESYLYGLKTFEQFENIDYDTVIYGLKKFIKLALQGNPSVLELFGVDDDCIVLCTKAGHLLRQNGQLFLSKSVIRSFGNYAIAQLRRLQNSLARDSYPQAEKEKHILDTLKMQQDHFRSRYMDFPEGSIRLYTDVSTKSQFEQEIFMDIELNHYPLRDFTNIYSEMREVVRSYNKLNYRNQKKDEPHLYKHAMHLIRLLITGTDILKGKGIITNRKAEQALLSDIRNGNYSFDEIFAMLEQYQEDFKDAAQHTDLPEYPHEEKAEELMKIIHDMYRAKP